MTQASAAGERLTRDEHAALMAWQRRMRTALLASALLLVGYAVFLVLAPDEPWVGTAAVIFAAPLVVTGALLQLSGRCPRCQGRVTMQARLSLPDRCPHCGVGFTA
jgi:hypothetical protein